MCESLSTARHEVTLHRNDGRALKYSLFGARDLKKVVFYSHGFPASRVEAMAAHRQALEQGITIVALDRPGFGGSEWYAGRRLEDWGDDVRFVADRLNIGIFGILGVSGGTPTAIAAAGLLADRVSSLVIVSGVGPVTGWQSLRGMNLINRSLLSLGVRMPWLARGGVWIIAQIWRAFPSFVAVWFGVLLPAVDRRIFSRREVALIMAKNIHEALVQGVRGVVLEFMLLASDWSPLLAKVRAPTVIWHGDADTYVPIGMGESLHRGIHGSQFRKVAGGGHFVILDTIKPVLESLV